jgi:hypothetical protein
MAVAWRVKRLPLSNVVALPSGCWIAYPMQSSLSKAKAIGLLRHAQLDWAYALIAGFIPELSIVGKDPSDGLRLNFTSS